MLATRDVFVPRLGLFPPSHRPGEHCSDRVKGHPWDALRPGLHDPFAEDKPVDSGAERPIAQRLQRSRMVEEIAVPVGERLGADNSPTINMGRGRDFIDDVA